MRSFDSPAVAERFDSFSDDVREALLEVRRLILETADALAQTGGVTETLKWHQPAYLAKRRRVGTTLRLGEDAAPGKYALYFHCQSRLGDLYRDRYGDQLRIVDDRSIVMSASEPVPKQALRHCIELALTYHLIKAG